MTFKTFGISGFHIFAYKFFLALTTSLKRTVKQRERGKRDNMYASRAGSFPRPRLGLPEATLLSTLFDDVGYT